MIALPPSLPAVRARIEETDRQLAERFWAGDDIDAIVTARAAFFDGLIHEIWTSIDWPPEAGERLALFTVGGYGRGELHPHSDIDLLVLVDGDAAQFRGGIETFVQRLWDLKLQIGHSVRTVEQCHQCASEKNSNFLLR